MKIKKRNFNSSYYIKGIRAIVVGLVSSLISLAISEHFFPCNYATFIPCLSIYCVLVFAIFTYKSSEITIFDNYLYFKGDLIDLLIILDKCGFDLSYKADNYFLLNINFVFARIGGIFVFPKKDKIVIFGNTKIIKMLSRDLPKLAVLYNEQKSL